MSWKDWFGGHLLGVKMSDRGTLLHRMWRVFSGQILRKFSVFIYFNYNLFETKDLFDLLYML